MRKKIEKHQRKFWGRGRKGNYFFVKTNRPKEKKDEKLSEEP